MTFYIFALLIGVTAGLRAATPLAAISLGAYLGWIDLSATWAGFMGSIITVAILVILAIAELVTDQLPKTPSRKVPQQFAARVVSGALAGLLLGLPSGMWIGGLIAGAIGAVLGTLGGYEARKRLVAATGGKDLPIALLEDVIAVGGALWVVSAVV